MEKTANRTTRFDSEFVFNYSLFTNDACSRLTGDSLPFNYSLFTNDCSL
jgi:hypothetical protein